jgi:anti-sigma regulatory factor (Ser/Thr protein kinase)
LHLVSFLSIRVACSQNGGENGEGVVSDTPAEASHEHHQTPPAQSPRARDAVWVSVLKGGATAPRRARREIGERLNGELAATRRQDAVLLAGELVANSVVHASGDGSREIALELVVGPDVVRVAVTDEGSPSVPTVRPPNATLETGRGLLLVEHLSDRWGITRDGSRRTCVWFEMLREQQPSI